LPFFLLAGCDKSNRQPSESPPRDSASAKTAPAQRPNGGGIFEDVTARSGLDFVHQLADGKLSNIMESDGAGGAFLDYDGNGFIDIYLVNSGPDQVLSDAPRGTARMPNRLYRNRGGGVSEDVTTQAGVEGSGFGITAAAGDYDNDGHADLFVVSFGDSILYRNRGDGTFQDVTAQAGLVCHGPGISATFLDYDRDGDLDLFVANYLHYDPTIKLPAGSVAPYPGPLAYEPEFNRLFRNRGDGTFEDVSEITGIRVPGHRAMSATSLDYDLDGDSDIYVSNDASPNLLLANDGQGRFTDVGLQAGVAFNQFGDAAGSMGAAVGDCDGDGYPDMLVTRFGNASLYMNSRGGLFEDRIQAAGILNVSAKFTGWGGNFIDFDNDGDLDVFIANGNPHFMEGMPCLLFENQGRGAFQDASAKAGPFFQTKINARGSGVVDFDNDGKLDILITTLGGRPVLLRNQSANQNHWLRLKLEGTRSNRDGFGAQVRVTVAGQVHYAEARCPTSYVFQEDTRLHFGLAAQTRADRLEIRWPSGQTQILTNIGADQTLLVREAD
jgi:hypothetical protein